MEKMMLTVSMIISTVWKATKKEIAALRKRLNMEGRRSMHHGIKWFGKTFGVWFSQHEGKLADIWSLSTACICNPYCMRRMKNEKLICHDCFADSLLKMRAGLRNRLIKNFEILSTRLFEIDELPFLNFLYTRIESFGDVYNITQARNYIRLAIRNPQTTFAWWSKNLTIIKQALELEGYFDGNKPQNIITVYSAPIKNVEIALETVHKYFKFVDKVFTVYSPEFLVRNPEYEKKICCGSKQCLSCLICYTHNDIKQVGELLK